MPENEDAVRREIRNLLDKINAAWTEGGNPEKLEDLFHADMVISGPDLREVGRGRKACVESYSRFSASSRTLDFKEADHRIEVWGDAALVSYRFFIDYEFEGQVNSDTGIDVFLFTREDGRWQAVWRIVLPVPYGSGEETAS